MKYNSIGEQLIAKAKELDPNYKPDKFNDMSEALNIILNNSGGGSGKDGDILDIGQYLIFNDGSNDKGIISQEGYEKLNSSNGKIIIAHFTNEMFDIDYPFIFEKWQEIDGTVYFVFYGIEIDSKSFKQHKKGMLTINMNTKTFVADYENISENISDNLIFPTTSPSSQVIPSITTSNEQQNLTIGNGLKINEVTSKLELDYRFVTLKFHNLTYKFDNSENAFNTLCIDITTYSYVLDFVLNEASSILGTQVNRNNISSLFTQFDSSTFLQFISGFIMTITTFELAAYSNFHIYESNTTQQNIINNYNALLIENLDGFFFPVYTGPETIKNLWIGGIGNELSKNENSTFTFNESWYGD